MEEMNTIAETEGENYDTFFYKSRHEGSTVNSLPHNRPNAFEVHHLMTMNKPLASLPKVEIELNQK